KYNVAVYRDNTGAATMFSGATYISESTSETIPDYAPLPLKNLTYQGYSYSDNKISLSAEVYPIVDPNYTFNSNRSLLDIVKGAVVIKSDIDGIIGDSSLTLDEKYTRLMSSYNESPVKFAKASSRGGNFDPAGGVNPVSIEAVNESDNKRVFDLNKDYYILGFGENALTTDKKERSYFLISDSFKFGNNKPITLTNIASNYICTNGVFTFNATAPSPLDRESTEGIHAHFYFYDYDAITAGLDMDTITQEEKNKLFELSKYTEGLYFYHRPAIKLTTPGEFNVSITTNMWKDLADKVKASTKVLIIGYLTDKEELQGNVAFSPTKEPSIVTLVPGTDEKAKDKINKPHVMPSGVKPKDGYYYVKIPEGQSGKKYRLYGAFIKGGVVRINGKEFEGKIERDVNGTCKIISQEQYELLPAGLYYIKVEDENDLIRFRVVKEQANGWSR
ncbi:MAG: hypothetical protein KKA19_03725, partial [Candidatus Margulisbacteria bacterium]|nr:hypothetical protein [Candidatus Margulisiibacteriota bacterium]